jgi:hypothetical protein
LKEDGYTLPLLIPAQLDLQVQVVNGKVTPTLEFQPLFDALRQRMLTELPKNKQMFKTVPSYASLDSISPPWGFISTSEGVLLSPYVQVTSTLDTTFSGQATFALIALLISRSSVLPHFQIDAIKNTIDLDLGVADDFAEVSDIPSVDGGSELRLIDPAVREREMRAEKERVRELFRAAEAEAEAWFEKYEPSDNESAFSEWMDQDETEA